MNVVKAEMRGYTGIVQTGGRRRGGVAGAGAGV
jgi:hypothetical protein